MGLTTTSQRLSTILAKYSIVNIGAGPNWQESSVQDKNYEKLQSSFIGIIRSIMASNVLRSIRSKVAVLAPEYYLSYMEKQIRSHIDKVEGSARSEKDNSSYRSISIAVNLVSISFLDEPLQSF